MTRRQTLRELVGAGLFLGAVRCASTTDAPIAAPAPVPTTGAAAATAVRATPTAAARTPKRGGTFRTASASTFPHQDPHQSANTLTWGWGIGLWYSRLVKYDVAAPQPALRPVPDLAERWEQPDDLTYIFKLRNARFHNMPPVNGRTATAADVIYSLDRIRTPGFPNAGNLEAIAKAETVDRSTLKLTLSRPSADFLVSLGAAGNAIVAREAVEAKGDLKEGPLIGTGAFIAEKIDPRGTSTLVRNPDYFLPGKPYLDGYQYIVVPDIPTQLAAFRAGELEILFQGILTIGEAENIRRARPDAQVPLFKTFGGTGVAMRLDRPPFHDLRVRRAVYKAIDAEAVIQTAFGAGWLAVGLPLPGLDWALPEDEIKRLYKRDLEGARRLLKEAGLENGLDATMPYLFLTPGSPYAAAGELIIAQLKEANIRVTGQPLDYVTFNERVTVRGEYEIAVGGYGALDSADATLLTRYHSKGAGNTARISDPKLDEMIEKQTTLGRDPEARKKLLLDIQRHIIDQAYPHAVLAVELPMAYQPYVRDYQGGGLLTSEPDRYTHAWLDK